MSEGTLGRGSAPEAVDPYIIGHEYSEALKNHNLEVEYRLIEMYPQLRDLFLNIRSAHFLNSPATSEEKKTD